MRIIVSPAKKMRVDTDSLACKGVPAFLAQTETILNCLKGMSEEELQALWKCNDKIARQNVERILTMDLRRGLTPAILSYEGIQYQYMAPGVFTDEQWDYVQEHLRILSGFYGVLRPLDGVTPYRLEMQAKLQVGESKDLYEFWGNALAEKLVTETDCILNLASKEYSVSVSKYLPKTVRMVTCVFGEKVNGKIVEKGTMCKMARGEMVRFMAENHITELQAITSFNRLGFVYSQEDSHDTRYVFLRKMEGERDEGRFC